MLIAGFADRGCARTNLAQEGSAQWRPGEKPRTIAPTPRLAMVREAASVMLPAIETYERVSLEYRCVQGVGVASLSGRLPSPLELERVGQEIVPLLGASGGMLVVDVSGVESVHCAVINWVLDMQRACQRVGGSLTLCGLSAAARDVLISTGLSERLRLADTREDALERAQAWAARGRRMAG